METAFKLGVELARVKYDVLRRQGIFVIVNGLKTIVELLKGLNLDLAVANEINEWIKYLNENYSPGDSIEKEDGNALVRDIERWRNLIEEATPVLIAECTPITDFRSTREYRADMVGQLFRMGMNKILNR